MLTVIILLSFFPVLAVAETVVTVAVDKSVIVFPDAQPYISEDNRVMVPVRFVAENLEAKVAWDGNSSTATILHGENTVIIRINNDKATLNGVEYTLDTPAVLRSDRAYVPLRFVSEMLRCRVYWNDAEKRADIIRPREVMAEPVIVGKGTAYELQGELTMPRDAIGPLKAVVLVQGSGPSDMNETIGPNQPFRDIAYYLSSQGFAVLRYDKRTYAHGHKMAADAALMSTLTVEQETMQDAILAADLLKSDSRIDAGKVYIAGHSLGGMLAPRIDAEGGDFAGLILLAGSPRAFWEIQYDQNMAILPLIPEGEQKKAAESMIEEERTKAQSLASMTDEQAMETTVFGVSAYYQKDLVTHPTKDYLTGIQKPVLVLQGGADFQVYAGKDFVMYQEILVSNENASFGLYDGLSHLFMRSVTGTTADYAARDYVDAGVLQDICDWLDNN